MAANRDQRPKEPDIRLPNSDLYLHGRRSGRYWLKMIANGRLKNHSEADRHEAKKLLEGE